MTQQPSPEALNPHDVPPTYAEIARAALDMPPGLIDRILLALAVERNQGTIADAVWTDTEDDR